MLMHADDFGYSASVNRAITDAFRAGQIHRTTLMVNMPYAEEAASLSRENGFFDKVGLHLNLTEGKALSPTCAASPLCDENGYFLGTFHVPLRARFYLGRPIRRAIYAEAEAQMQKYISMGFPLMHMDSHNYTHVYISVYSVVRKLLKKYGFTSVRISRNIPENDFSLPFAVYKGLFNFLLRHLRVGGKQIRTTKYFGSVQDFERLAHPEKYRADVEIMTHPDYIEGVLTDNTLPSPHPFRGKAWQTGKKEGEKESLLLCFLHAHVGGAMTSFVNFVNALDTEKYDIDVLFYEKGEGRYGIREDVRILPPAKMHQAGDVGNILRKGLSPAYLWAKVQEIYCKKIRHNKKMGVQIMSRQGCRYSAVSPKSYDIALAFEMTWPLNYVMQRVEAKKKLLWIHNDFEKAGLSFKVDKKAFDTASALVFVSGATRESFLRAHPSYAKKSFTMPNLLTAAALRARGEEACDWPLSEKALTFLSVSRINFDEKGLDRAARVFKRLRDDGLLEGVRWIVVGKGRDEEKFRALLSEYGLADIILPVGLRENPIPYMKRADILFLPSIHEGKPMVVTEGLIMGLVPVVTAYTSSSEQLRAGRDGIILENTEEGLYAGLRALLENRGMLDTYRETIQNTNYGNENDIAIFYEIVEAI